MGVPHLSYLIGIFVLLNINHVTSLHTSFCIRLPLGDWSYEVTGDADVTSVGIEKFPQDIWGPYFWDRESPADRYTHKPTTERFYRYKKELKLNIHLYSLHGRVFGNMEPLSGWFRVSVEFNIEGGIAGFFKSFILTATDEQHNPIGEFVYGFPKPDVGQTDCEPNDATKYMLIPCGGVSKNEAFASNVVLFARNDTRRDGNIFPGKYQQYWPIVPDFGPRRNLNFYFRMSVQDSNRNKEKAVVFRIIADPDEKYVFNRPTALDTKLFDLDFFIDKVLVSQTAWFTIKEGAVQGAADPLPTDPEDVSCLERVYFLGVTNVLDQDARDYRGYHWYMKDFFGTPELEASGKENDKLTGMLGVRANTILSYSGCLAKNHFGGRCNFAFCQQATQPFSARRRPSPKSGMIPVVHSTKTANCPPCSGLAHNFPTFVKCIEELHDEPKIFNNQAIKFGGLMEVYEEAQMPTNCNRTEDDANAMDVTVIRYPRGRKVIQTKVTKKNASIEIKNSNERITFSGDREKVDRRGVRTLGYGTILYSVRKGHGVAMCIISLFLMPISIFASRYYKETFMGTRILYTRPWFQIHIQLVFWMFGFYFAGILFGIVGRGFIGVSLTGMAMAHRIIGWIGFLLFLFVGLTGGIRSFQEPGRTCTIGTHWLLGYLVYALNVLSMITSVHIPGSPSADDDESTKDSDGALINKMYLLLGFWLVYETAMHVGMTVLIYMYDRWMQVEEPRKFIPPVIGVPIPVLKENTTEDASGYGMRLIVLCGYIGIAGLMTAGAVGSILTNKPQANMGYGPMSCTHEWWENVTRYAMMSRLDPSCGP